MVAFGTILLLCKGDVTDKIQSTRSTLGLRASGAGHCSRICAPLATTVVFYFFDFKNKGRTVMRPDEMIMFMDCAMRGVSKVKRLEAPAFEVIVQNVEDFLDEQGLQEHDEIDCDTFVVWFKKDVRRVACIDTSAKVRPCGVATSAVAPLTAATCALLQNLAKLGNMIVRHRDLLDEVAEVVGQLEEYGVDTDFDTLDLGQKWSRRLQKRKQEVERLQAR